MRTLQLIPAVGLFCAAAALAQTSDTQPPSGVMPSAAQPANPLPAAIPASSASDAVAPKEDKRIFGVIPNNRTTEGSIPFHAISAKQKMTIAMKDSFDWPVYPTAALFATLYQLEDQNPSFGQGMAGYGRRFGTAVADQIIGNMMTEGIVPSMIHQDPRYFRIGADSGYSTGRRAWMSVKQIVVCRMDSGKRSFNFSEWGGNALGTAISNAYYPDTRDVNDNVEKWLVAIATDTFSNVLKEFWPDVKMRLTKHKRDKDPLVSASHPEPAATAGR